LADTLTSPLGSTCQSIGGTKCPGVRIEALRCAGLTKRFGGRAVVQDLDLSVGQGEVFGFLGPNGAGKTTTIKMLLGLLRIDAGEAHLLGERVPCPRQLADVGAMVEEPAFYPWLSGRNNLRVLGNTGAAVPRGGTQAALDRVSLTDSADRKVHTYSQGMRQRLGLAAALLRRPSLLILDEPANGLDPSGIHEFRTLLRELGDSGVSVFLSSHLLSEIEQVCDRVAVLAGGRLVEVASTAALGRSEVSIEVGLRPEDVEPAIRLLTRFTVIGQAGGVLTVASDDGRAVNQTLATGGVFAGFVRVHRPGLEERFLGLTRGEAAGAADPG
jgi:ABC-2 type transport system ATP-binding protein